MFTREASHESPPDFTCRASIRADGRGLRGDLSRLRGALHAYLARLTGDRWAAEELCQETFVRYLRHRAALTGAKGSLAAWLFRVATNLARDRARRNARSLPPPPEPGPGGNEMAEAREIHERVRALLYTAYPVPPAPPDLAPRAWALARPQRLPALLRYAAAFAAGALFMLLLRDRPAPPETAPVADSTPLVFENRIVR